MSDTCILMTDEEFQQEINAIEREIKTLISDGRIRMRDGKWVVFEREVGAFSSLMEALRATRTIQGEVT